MGIDNGRRVRLVIAGLFAGEAGESRGVVSFIPTRKARPSQLRLIEEGELDGAPVALSFIGADGPFASYAWRAIEGGSA
jgi:hypothetical protein